MDQPSTGARRASLMAVLLRLPRSVLVVSIVAMLLAGAFAPAPFGPLLLFGIAALTAWLAWTNWGVTTVGGRLVRLLVPLALLAFAATKF